MADPVLVDHFRAQVVFQGKSNLAEDRWINNFVFRNDSVIDSPHEEITAALTKFYNDLTTGASTIANFLTPLRSSTVRINTYDLGQPPPRTPVSTNFECPVATASVIPPEECAGVLSYYAGRNQPRSRGRIYLGPLNGNAFQNDGIRVQLNTTFVNTLLGRALVLRDDNTVGWVLLSQADAATKEITGGWVDNAPDTQRRRGQDATLRSPWGSPPT